MRRTLLLLTALLLVYAPPGFAQKAVMDSYNFGSVGVEAPVGHTFEFQNDRPEALEISKVQLATPLTVTRMTARVEPGKNGSVTVRMGTPREKGDFKGFVAVNFKNPGLEPLYFWVVGRLVAPIEFDPFAAFFLSVQRGQSKTESILVTSHEADPLEIQDVIHASSRFTTQLETLEPGRRFRLSLTVKPDAPAGRETEYITLVTSSREHPYLKVQANTVIHERVYTFPEAINLGSIPATSLKTRPQLIRDLSQSLMVYQKGGTDLQISARTDVPFLRLTSQQAQLKDRFGISIAIVPEHLKAGEINGSIFIATNDPEFPLLVVPVKGSVDKDW